MKSSHALNAAELERTMFDALGGFQPDTMNKTGSGFE